MDILEIYMESDSSVFYSKGKHEKEKWVSELNKYLEENGEDPLDLPIEGVIYGRSRYSVSSFWSEYDFLIMPWGNYGQRGAFDITSHEDFRYFSDFTGSILQAPNSGQSQDTHSPES